MDGESDKLAIVPPGTVEPGLTISVVEAVLAAEAAIVAAVGEKTLDVVTGNVTVVCPAGTVTAVGTVAAALLLDRLA